jgi:putative membrane protein
MTGGKGAVAGSLAGDRYPLLLLGIFGVIFVALGIHPWFRQDWLLENMLVFAALAVFIPTYRRMRFSNLAYTLLFAFFVLHEVGAHYTYSLVPYDSWFERLGGMSLSARFGLARNQYDRVIHFTYGLFMLVPAIELLRAVSPPRGIWRHLLPVLFILSHSALYELIEYGAALAFGGDLGTAYNGTQGDPWDSQKDMLCALAGSLLAMTVVVIRDIARRGRPVAAIAS